MVRNIRCALFKKVLREKGDWCKKFKSSEDRIKKLEETHKAELTDKLSAMQKEMQKKISEAESMTGLLHPSAVDFLSPEEYKSVVDKPYIWVCRECDNRGWKANDGKDRPTFTQGGLTPFSDSTASSWQEEMKLHSAPICAKCHPNPGPEPKNAVRKSPYRWDVKKRGYRKLHLNDDLIHYTRTDLRRRRLIQQERSPKLTRTMRRLVAGEGRANELHLLQS